MHPINSQNVRLPNTLRELWGRQLLDGTRLELNKVTRDPRARIIYGLNDTAAPLAHVGVLLLGRCVGGWIIELGTNDDNAFEAVRTEGKSDAVSRNLAQSLIASPKCGNDSLVRDFGTQRHDLQLLNTRHGIVKSGSQGEPYERVVTTWKRSATTSLIDAVGATEIYRLKQDLFDKYAKVQAVGLVIPSEKSWDWECVTTESAFWRARNEMRTPAFWTLPQRTKTVSFTLGPEEASEANPVATLRSIWHGLVMDADHDLSSPFITGLLEIEVSGRRNGRTAHLVVKRSYRDKRWYLTLKIDGKISSVADYNIIAGREAMKLAELTFQNLTAPARHDDMDQEASSLVDFDKLVTEVHQHQRQLGFVCEAYGLSPPSASSESKANGSD